MVTPTGDEQYYQLPEVQEEEFEQVWFQAENPFAQFDKVGKKRRNLEIIEIQEEINSAKIRKLNEEIENYKIQLSNNSQQMGIVIEQNDRLQEDNEKLIDENSELGKKLEKATNEKTKVSSILNLVNDELEELQEEHNNLVQLLNDNRDRRFAKEFRLKKGTPVIELLD